MFLSSTVRLPPTALCASCAFHKAEHQPHKNNMVRRESTHGNRVYSAGCCVVRMGQAWEALLSCRKGGLACWTSWFDPWRLTAARCAQ